MKTQTWNIFVKNISDTGLFPECRKIYKEFSTLNNKKKHNAISNYAKGFNRNFTKDRDAKYTFKKCSNLLVLQEMQTKTTVHMHIRMATFFEKTRTNVGPDMEQLASCTLVVGR